MFGAPNLIARIYVFALIEYLRLFGRIRGLSWETDQEERLKKNRYILKPGVFMTFL